MSFLTSLVLSAATAEAADPVVCLVGVSAGDGSNLLLEVDLDSGAQSTVVSTTANLDAVRGFVTDGSRVGFVSGERVITMDLASGEAREETASGGSLGGTDAVLLTAASGPGAAVFETLEAAATSGSTPRSSPVFSGFGSVAVEDGVLVSARPTGKLLTVRDSSGQHVSWFVATSVSGAIWGLSLANGTLYALDDGMASDPVVPSVRAFDPTSGETGPVVPVPLDPGHLARGLACRVGP